MRNEARKQKQNGEKSQKEVIKKCQYSERLTTSDEETNFEEVGQQHEMNRRKVIVQRNIKCRDHIVFSIYITKQYLLHQIAVCKKKVT